MKKMLLMALLVSFSTSIYSQVEITPTFGYTISGKIKTDQGYLNVQGATSYGGIFGFEVMEHSFIEFTYRRSTPTVVAEGYRNENIDGQFESGIEQYNLGFSQEFEISNDQVLPFVNFTMGSTRYFTKTDFNYESWLFSMSFGGGVKIFLTDNIGLRFQTNLVLPSAFGGNNIYCDPWYGCYPVSTYYIPLVHWDNSLGIIFKF